VFIAVWCSPACSAEIGIHFMNSSGAVAVRVYTSSGNNKVDERERE
jgi:hypothetical protein